MGSLWPRSGTIERYSDDLRAPGAQAFFFAGGTTTPITVYRDVGEGSAHPTPVLSDARGRWPDIFIPYSAAGYDVQVLTADGAQLTYTIQVPNPNPISVPAPPATDGLQTGMIHAEMASGTKAGFVRLNGRTIGNAVSGATERANADTQNLFVYLWNLNNNIAPVSGGRGASGAADFAANKTIQLVSARGSVFAGLDDMGNTTAGLFTAQTFGTGHSSTTPGSACGGNSKTLQVSNLAPHTHPGSSDVQGVHSHGGATGSESGHTHSGTTGNQSVDHTHSGTSDSAGAHAHNLSQVPLIAASTGSAGGGNLLGTSTATVTTTDGAHTHTFTSGIQSTSHTHSFTTGAGSAHSHSIASDGGHSHNITVGATGAGSPFDNMPNVVLVTWYIKL